MRWLWFIVSFVWLLASPVNAQTLLAPHHVTWNEYQMLWSWSQGTGGLPTEYHLYCGTKSGVYPTKPTLTIPYPATSLNAPIPGLNVGTTYYGALTAANAAGESPKSNEVVFTVVTPGAQTLIANGTTYIFTWQPTKGATRFRIYLTSGARRTLIGDSTQPYFTIAPPKGILTHWIVTDVMPDGSEVSQRPYGFWIQG